MFKPALTFSVCLALLFASAYVAADPSNYQRYVIGERSLGMAGAYAAATDDSMAIYYNPGALVFAGTTAVSASKSVYAADHRTIRRGFVPNFEAPRDTIDLDNSNDLSWPSTLTFMTTFGKKKKKKEAHAVRHSLGFAMLVPHQEAYSFRGKLSNGPGVQDTETYFLSESNRTTWTGLSYSIRPHKKLGIGLSAFWSNYKYNRRYDSNYYNPPEDPSTCAELGCGELEAVESILRINTNSAIFRLGFLVAPSDRLRLGLTVTSPSILMPRISSGNLDQTRGISSTGDPTQDYSRLYTDDYNLRVASHEPTSFRLGVAYTLPHSFTIDLDFSLHLPTSYRRIKGNAVATRLENSPESSPEWFDPAIVKKIERELVLNTNLGGEFMFAGGWTVRTGLFTDFSSAPRVVAGDEPQLTRVHRIGGAFSVGHRGKNHDIAIGLIGTYGRGTASIYQPELARGPEGHEFSPEDYSERSIFVFISGFQKALEKGTEKLIEKIVD